MNSTRALLSQAIPFTAERERGTARGKRKESCTFQTIPRGEELELTELKKSNRRPAPAPLVAVPFPRPPAGSPAGPGGRCREADARGKRDRERSTEKRIPAVLLRLGSSRRRRTDGWPWPAGVSVHANATWSAAALGGTCARGTARWPGGGRALNFNFGSIGWLLINRVAPDRRVHLGQGGGLVLAAGSRPVRRHVRRAPRQTTLSAVAFGVAAHPNRPR
jgi:hypothetical protein